MTGGYVYSPYIWLFFFTTILLVAFCGYASRCPSVPGALPFASGRPFTAFWMAAPS